MIMIIMIIIIIIIIIIMMMIIIIVIIVITIIIIITNDNHNNHNNNNDSHNNNQNASHLMMSQIRAGQVSSLPMERDQPKGYEGRHMMTQKVFIAIVSSREPCAVSADAMRMGLIHGGEELVCFADSTQSPC